MAKRKAKKGARKAAKAKRVRVKLRGVRAEIERGIRTLTRGVNQAKGRADKKTLDQARKRIKRLQNAVRELKADCPDDILDPKFLL